MHDSRGAALKVGDRVLIEAKVTELNSGDENFCCCTVEVVLPEQTGQEKVMNHRPTVSAMSTKMLTKVGAAILLALFLLPQSAFAQDSISERLSRLEANNAAISAAQARIQSDVTDLKADVSRLSEKLDALARAVAPNANFAASTQDEWGRGASASFGSASSAQSNYQSSNYGSAASRPRLFGGRSKLLSGKLLGKCAGGG